MKIGYWIKKGLEGKDGKASHRKLAALTLMIDFQLIIIAEIFFGRVVSFYLTIGVLSLSGIAWGLVTAQNVVDIFKRPSNSYYADDLYDMGRRSNSGNIPDPTEDIYNENQ
jgi:hypothetical protein